MLLSGSCALPSRMDLKSKVLLCVQILMGRIAIFIAAPLVLSAINIAGYQVKNIDTVRRKVRNLMRNHPGPWLICANHLTLIDSVILAHAMIPAYRYIFQYHLLPWNVPEYLNFNRNIFVGIACFLTKCIPVIRGGDRDVVKSTIGKCAYLLNKGENVMIFPEGTRARNGRINTVDFPYGTGRLFYNTPGCRVMCIYLRGDGQETYSDFPKKGEIFTMTVEECSPKTRFKGLKAHRDCTRQIIEHLSQMEKNYFNSCRQ
jgi:1-acyl-sn-glycerol-3-phosphate acyltransferase